MNYQNKIKNVAIIAHVDHGKTTLVDSILRQCKVFRENEEEMKGEQILDFNELEREKGVTIFAKNVSVHYKDYKINIIDTPGHADFGGEVERTLNMAEGCILVVDAQEGPMIQTRVVLRKAMELNLKPIVLINKIDKKLADIKSTVIKIQDLFLEFAVNEDQLDFPILYAIGREGKAFYEVPSGDLTIKNSIQGDMRPLLDTIISTIPSTIGDPNEPFQMQISSLDFDSHNGRYLIGKIKRGTVKANASLVLVSGEKNEILKRGTVKKILTKEGLQFKEIDSASVGEIVAIVGIETTKIGATLCSADKIEPLPQLKISPPSIRVVFEPNSSPFVGKEGKLLTPDLLRKRLEKEAETNVNIVFEKSVGESNFILVRGEFQLAILIETLRREGFEFQIGKPSILFKEVDGKKMEPIEDLSIEVPEEYVNVVVQELSTREAELVDMQTNMGKTQFRYKILTRNLLGLRSKLFSDVKGQLVFNSAFIEFVEVKESKIKNRKGVIISTDTGITVDYSLNTIQDRGVLFVKSGEPVYEGMIIGINKYDEDIEVNPTKERKRSGVRVSHAVITLSNIRPIFPLTLDFAISFVADDELIEVTPQKIRLRKKHLSHQERVWLKRKTLTAIAKKKLGIK